MPPPVGDINFNENIVSGLYLRLPDLDLVRAREVGLDEAVDPVLLEWAAAHGRVVMSHDRQTLVGFAYERVTQRLPMPGLVSVEKDCPVGRAIDDLMVIMLCSAEGELEDRVVFVPL